MAHEIDQTTGRAAVFVSGEAAWHRLGTVIEHAASSAEAIGPAGLSGYPYLKSQRPISNVLVRATPIWNDPLIASLRRLLHHSH